MRRLGRFPEPMASTPDPALAATLAWIEGAPGSSQPTVPIARRAARTPSVSTVRGYTRTVPNQLVRIGTGAPISPAFPEPAPETDPGVRNLFNEWQQGHTERIGAKQVELQLKIAKFLEQDFTIQMPVMAGQITYSQAMTAWSALSAALFAVDWKIKFELLIPALQDRVKAVHEQCLIKWHRNIEEIRNYLSYPVHPATMPDFLEDKDKLLINKLVKQNQPIQTWLSGLIVARNNHREAQRAALANPMVQQQPIQFDSGRTVTFGAGARRQPTEIQPELENLLNQFETPAPRHTAVQAAPPVFVHTPTVAARAAPVVSALENPRSFPIVEETMGDFDALMADAPEDEPEQENEYEGLYEGLGHAPGPEPVHLSPFPYVAARAMSPNPMHRQRIPAPPARAAPVRASPQPEPPAPQKVNKPLQSAKLRLLEKVEHFDGITNKDRKVWYGTWKQTAINAVCLRKSGSLFLGHILRSCQKTMSLPFLNSLRVCHR